MEVHDFPNYLIYEDGRVFSKKGKGRFLKPYDNGLGYKIVYLWNQGKRKCMLIHRLVALHYIPNSHNYPEVDHIDRNKSNNDILNLRWADRFIQTQNTGTSSNNKLGHKNIFYHKSINRYVYQKTIRGKAHIKYFKSLEEAIAYKSAFET